MEDVYQQHLLEKTKVSHGVMVTESSDQIPVTIVLRKWAFWLVVPLDVAVMDSSQSSAGSWTLASRVACP